MRYILTSTILGDIYIPYGTYKKYDVYREGCISRDVMELIGAKWTILVLTLLETDVKRYNQLQRAIPGITQKMLTATLRKLDCNGLVRRKVYPVVPPKVEYSLTPLGVELVGSLKPLIEWSELHADEVKASRERYSKNSKS